LNHSSPDYLLKDLNYLDFGLSIEEAELSVHDLIAQIVSLFERLVMFEVVGLVEPERKVAVVD